MKKNVLVTFSLFLFLTVFFLSDSYAVKLKIGGGSTTINTILKPIQEPFKEKTGIELVLLPLGGKQSVFELDKGNLDAICIAHPLSELIELNKKDNVVLTNQDKFVSTVVWKEVNYVFVVNKSNPVRKLSQAQLKDIYIAKVTNWKQVGGEDLPIKVIIGKLTPGTTNVIIKNIIKDDTPIKPAKEGTTDLDILKFIESNKDAIGVVAKGSINTPYVSIVETIPLVSEPAKIVTIGQPSVVINKLVDFIKKEGEKYIK